MTPKNITPRKRSSMSPTPNATPRTRSRTQSDLDVGGGPQLIKAATPRKGRTSAERNSKNKMDTNNKNPFLKHPESVNSRAAQDRICKNTETLLASDQKKGLEKGPTSSAPAPLRNANSEIQNEATESSGTNKSGKPLLYDNKTIQRSKRKEKRKKRKLAKERKKESLLECKATAPNTAIKSSIDVTVHRIRHIEYHPKPILCIKASPPCGTEDFVAVSRENGYVEIRSANEKLRVVTTIAGTKVKPVNVMTWTCSQTKRGTTEQRPLLIGGCRDGSLFLLDYRSGTIKGDIQSGGGGVFSLVSLCHKHCCRDACSQLVAAGCEDGSVRIFQVQPLDSTLTLVSTVPSAGSAVLSITWSRKNLTGHQESSIFAGIADGTIRRYDFHGQSDGSSMLSGTWKSSVRMTVESLGRSTPTRVWALETLSDGTLISADSLGHVQFWDGVNGTLEQSFDQNENKADVLALAVTADETVVYATGVDSRVVCVERPPLCDRQQPVTSKWVVTNAQRPHTHDANALAIFRVFRGDQLLMEVLSTGGVDTKLCTYDARNFRKSRPRVLYPWPCNSISTASNARLFIVTRESSVDIYRLGDIIVKERLPVTLSESKSLVGSIKTSNAANLVCSAISTDAKHLAMADASTVYLFRVALRDGVMKPTRINVDMPVGISFQAMCFSHDGSRLLIAGSESLYCVDFSRDEGTMVLLSGKPSSVAPLRGCPASTILVSENGGFVVTLRSGVRGSFVDVFKKVSLGSVQYWWTLPLSDELPSAISFIEGDSLRLAVACAAFSLYIFDIESRQVNKWSEAAGYPVSSSLPIELRQRTDYPVRLFSAPGLSDTLIMVSHSFCRAGCCKEDSGHVELVM